MNFYGFQLRPLSPVSWVSGYWPVPFSSLDGLFHQFPYCSGYQARRVHHFPDFNLGSFFTFKNIFIIKNPTDFSKTVEIGADPFQPNCPLNLSLQCLVECWRVIVEIQLSLLQIKIFLKVNKLETTILTIL